MRNTLRLSSKVVFDPGKDFDPNIKIVGGQQNTEKIYQEDLLPPEDKRLRFKLGHRKTRWKPPGRPQRGLAVGVRMPMTDMWKIERWARISDDDFINLVRWALDVKHWPSSYVALMSGMEERRIKRILNQTDKPTGTEKRILWMLYALDTDHNMLFDPVVFLSWGKLRGMKIKHRTSSKTTKAKVIAFLTAEKEKTSGQLTCREVAEKFGMARHNVYPIARLVGHQFPKQPVAITRRKRATTLFDPWMPWVHQDWTLSNSEIAKRMKAHRSRVYQVRYMFFRLTKEQLLRVFENAGRGPEAAEPFLRVPQVGARRWRGGRRSSNPYAQIVRRPVPGWVVSDPKSAQPITEQSSPLPPVALSSPTGHPEAHQSTPSK